VLRRQFLKVTPCSVASVRRVMPIMARDILRHARPSADVVRHELSGQICRCTGYANIVKAIVAPTGARSVATSEE
jgi:carbon-monoxide dehydrogenase small subunit